jgi:hypothetical protein
MTVLTNPLRLEIMKRLSDALREITPANGYVMDYSGAEGTDDNKVFRGRAYFGDESPLPMLSILETPIQPEEAPTPQDATERTVIWELMVQGFFEDDKQNPTDPAYVGMADVTKRLVEEKAKLNWDEPEEGPLGLGNAIISVRIGTGVVRPPDEVSAKAYFWLVFALELAEDLSDHYTV